MAIIKKLPLQDRPREKAIKNGIESLSDYELLAIILQSGCKDKSALQLAMELIICFKGLYNVFNTSIYELNKISGINNVKAIQIKTIKELFVRFTQTNINSTELVKLSSGYDVYNYASLKYNNYLQEKLVVFFLNIKNVIIHEQVISIGNDSCSINNNKLICKIALEKYAKKVIVCHNHPSGNAFPSLDDISSCISLKSALNLIQVKLVDNIILGNNQFYSLIDESLFKVN